MNALNQQTSLQVVSTLSNLPITKEQLNAVNVLKLIENIKLQQSNLDSASDELKRAKAEKEAGNFLGNWWYDRDDAIKDASQDLSIVLGDLTSNTSKLVVFNTAISKVILEQQNLLKKQQEQLNQQTEEIKQQNDTIIFQQEEIQKAHDQLKTQQIEINNANRGLMEAKGITSEQAIKLVRVTEKTEQLKTEMLAEFDNKSAQIIEIINENNNRLEYLEQSTKEALDQNLITTNSTLQKNVNLNKELIERYYNEIVDKQLSFENEIIKKMSDTNDSINEIINTQNKKLKKLLTISSLALISGLSTIGFILYLLLTKTIAF